MRIIAECVVPTERMTGSASIQSRAPVTAQIGTPWTIKKWMSIKKLGVSSEMALVFDEADHMLTVDGFEDDSLRIKEIDKYSPQCQALVARRHVRGELHDWEKKKDKERKRVAVLEEPRKPENNLGMKAMKDGLAHAEEAQKDGKEEDGDLPNVKVPQVRKVYTKYSVIAIPGDGRCLFRTVSYGNHLRAGREALAENRQMELADELRAKVVEELLKRRNVIEPYFVGNFDKYISYMSNPNAWGDEYELLMASRVLEIPIRVYRLGEELA